MVNNHRNAIILAAGTASRFAPLSAERPKGLLEVKGEILIERQIRQLKEAGIEDVTIVVGYKADMFAYLKEKFGVNLVFNKDFYYYNNTSSIICVLDKLRDTYICSSDNYFPHNVFLEAPEQSFYSALYAEGETTEYCLTTDAGGNIINVDVGGCDSWYMIGHVYFSDDFSQKFKQILAVEYEKDQTKQGYWEDVYIRFIDVLPLMRIRKYKEHEIEEFDSIDELRLFDESYQTNTRSSILKQIVIRLNCREEELSNFQRVKHNGDYLIFTFRKGEDYYKYDDSSDIIEKL